MKAEFGYLEFLSLIIAAFLGGLAAGVSANEGSTINDCKTMGRFRVNNSVYLCQLEAK